MFGDSSIRVTVALATPVRPDILGERLEDYEKVVPTLRTPRLCHRFGRGSDVHITRLPAELELAIEACIVRSNQSDFRSYSERIQAFRHYEGRCAPMDHIPDWRDRIEDRVASQNLKKCGNCEDMYWYPEKCKNICDSTSEDLCWYCSQQPNPLNCGRTCMAKHQHAMNAIASKWDFDVPCAGSNWERMIDSSPTGAFARCNQVLREHFGLEASFFENRISKDGHDTWPRHPNHQWHNTAELKTTICYLTAMKQVVRKKEYGVSEYEGQFEGAIVRGLQTIVPKRLGNTVESEVCKRFKRALNVLCMKPYIHLSQQHNFLDRGEKNKSNDAAHPAPGSQKDRAEEWPKQVFLMESEADCTFEL